VRKSGKAEKRAKKSEQEKKGDVLVQVDLLHALGHPWRAANLQG
jgi:hypothetical protein